MLVRTIGGASDSLSLVNTSRLAGATVRAGPGVQFVLRSCPQHAFLSGRACATNAGTQISFFPKQDIRGLVDGPEFALTMAVMAVSEQSGVGAK